MQCSIATILFHDTYHVMHICIQHMQPYVYDNYGNPYHMSKISEPVIHSRSTVAICMYELVKQKESMLKSVSDYQTSISPSLTSMEIL